MVECNLSLSGAYTPPVGEVNLRLGEAGSTEETTGVLSGGISPLGALFTGATGASGNIMVTLGVGAALSGQYLINVWRGLVRQSALAYGMVRAGGYGQVSMSFASTKPYPEVKGDYWASGAPVGRSLLSPIRDLARMRLSSVPGWGRGRPLNASFSGRFSSLEPLPTGSGVSWIAGAQASACWSSPWIYLIFRPVEQTLPHSGAPAGPTATGRLIWRGAPIFSPKGRKVFWDLCGRPVFVWPPPEPPEPPGPPEPVEPYRGSTHLRLECLLVAWGGYVPLHIPTICRRRRRAWVVINEIVLRRLSDNAVIPCTAVDIYGDMDSWAWGFDAQVPLASSLALLHPAEGPVEVEAVINGWTWRGVVEGFTEKRVYGQHVYAVAGRSRSAMLAAPYAPARSYISTEARTAVQLAEAELSGTGWALDWDTVDWLVPAGAFAYERETPMGAVVRLAQAVGAVVQTDAAALTLRAFPRYATSPWDWAGATPGKVIPEDLLYQTSARWERRPAYNGVYVSGVTQGVLCRVHRSGTSGAPYRDMISDPLITHVDAGRERGRIALSASGRWEIVGAELPVVSSGPGVLLPGTLVEIDGAAPWVGQVLSCRISAAPAYVRQAVDIERYMEET